MAFTLDTKYLGARGNAAPYGFNYTCGAGSTLFILSIVTQGSTARAGGAPTLGGIALTQAWVNQQAPVAPETDVELWYLINPPIGTNAVSIPNTGAAKYIVPVASSYITTSGTTSEYVTSTGNGGTTSIPTLDIIGAISGDLIVAVVGSGSDAWNPVTRTGTQLYDTDEGTYGTGSQYYVAIASDPPVLWMNIGSDDWAMIGVAFREVSTAVSPNEPVKVIDYVAGIVVGAILGALSISGVSETIKVADGLWTLGEKAIVRDVATVGISQETGTSFDINVFDPVKVRDGFQQIKDSVAVDDYANILVITPTITGFDVRVTDNVKVRESPFTRAIYDRIKVEDVPTVLIRKYFINVSDPVRVWGYADISAINLIGLSASDSVKVRDEVSATQSDVLALTVYDDVKVREDVTRNIRFTVINVSDSVISRDEGYIKQDVALAVDSVIVRDVPKVTVNITISVYDDVINREATYAGATIYTSVSDVVIITDIPSGSLSPGFNIQVYETVISSDFGSGIPRYLRPFTSDQVRARDFAQTLIAMGWTPIPEPSALWIDIPSDVDIWTDV